MSYKRKYRGVAYVSKVLVKYGGKKRYSSYADRLSNARTIVSDLRSKGVKVTVKSVMSLVRKKRVPKYVPSLPAELTALGQNFFRLVDYPNEIESGVDARIKFVYFPKFGVVPKGLPPIGGGTAPDYTTYFSGFVNYCNELNKLAVDEDAYEEDWFVRCSEPDPKTFESRIYSCDKDGVPTDYGFDNTSPLDKPDELIQKDYPENKPIKPSEPESGVTIPKANDNEVELAKIKSNEKIREAKIHSIEKMFEKGKITFDQYVSAISKI
jgi:hypothetical protein